MQTSLVLAAMSAVIIVSACKHPLEIIGEGDIVSSSGNHDCSLEDFQAGAPSCAINQLSGNYFETYTAVPRPGWSFQGWRSYCAHDPAVTECSFNWRANWIAAFSWYTARPLRAAFIEDCAVPGCIQSLPPILGAVTDTSIKIWQATKLQDADFKVRYRTGTDPWIEASIAISSASGWTGVHHLGGLLPNTDYEYETLLNDTLNHSGSFSTLPDNTWTGTVRFGFAADLDHLESPFPALAQAVSKDFDFMLMIGDLMYADVGPAASNNPDSYSDRYWLTWDEPNFSALSTSTPMFMTWDDHELWNDFYPGSQVPDIYPAAREAYDRFQGSHNPDTDGGVLYYPFSVPGADFFVLDTRSHRDPNSDVDDIDKSMLGETQRAALLDFLEASTAAFKFIVTSVPFALGEPSDDTWYSYQTERNFILAEIESRGITGVAFISGDRHWSGVTRITSAGGYDYYDFLPTPAGTHLRPLPGTPHPNELVIYLDNTYRVIGDFQIDLSGAVPSLRMAFVDDTGVDRCVITITSNDTGVLTGGSPPACL